LIGEEKVYGFAFEGVRHDAGDKLGMLKAMVDFTLQRDDLGPQFREYLKGLSL
jgi:UTP--glucose-1-phosphate uridylyltransferase